MFFTSVNVTVSDGRSGIAIGLGPGIKIMRTDHAEKFLDHRFSFASFADIDVDLEPELGGVRLFKVIQRLFGDIEGHHDLAGDSAAQGMEVLQFDPAPEIPAAIPYAVDDDSGNEIGLGPVIQQGIRTDDHLIVAFRIRLHERDYLADNAVQIKKRSESPDELICTDFSHRYLDISESLLCCQRNILHFYYDALPDKVNEELMAKKSTSRDRRKENSDPKLHPDTKSSVLAVAFIGVAAILVLGGLGEAGPAGAYIYGFLSEFLGWGYYLIPTILAIMSANFFVKSERQKLVWITVMGGVLFVLSGLGIMDIISPNSSGLIGSVVGGIQIFFGYWAALVINATIAIASVLVTLNRPIRLALKRAERPDGEEVEKKKTEAPKIIIPQAAPEKTEAASEAGKKEVKADSVKLPKVPIYKSKSYVPPPLDLLKSTSEKPTVGDLRANANIIKRTLESFGIPVEMGEITIGPKVTRYTLKPAEGVKLSRITALNQDLSLALAAHPIRIEAPIPGKSLVGIEIPNKVASIVRLGSILGYPEFSNSGLLNFPLGRDVSGDPIFANLAKMPHILVAGATGAGKSVFVHSFIISLLYKNSPETLRLILIDPKRVELSTYEGLPHLASPVITEGKKAVAALRFGVEEMERRYETLLNAGNRDIEGYNNKRKEDLMPYLVIVIDELADLMAAFGREVEGYIVRLAQMARATGIHLVVSTQRPSVEVITGLIKANITARVALQVASQVDSRTILDAAGAEKLLGGGDMLFISGELSKPKRIQGAFVTEEEAEKVIEFINKSNSAPEESGFVGKVEDVLNRTAENQDSDDDDELYEEALEVVRSAKKASASLLQRRLKVGYARAARLLDIMEAHGVIGPGEGAKPREVYQDNYDE